MNHHLKSGKLKNTGTMQAAAIKTGKNSKVITDNRSAQTIQKKENNTGLPDNLKSGIENLSGISLDNVKVHYNSSKPAQLNAHAYAQGSEIEVGPGKEKHLPHEAWHIVQQATGRVRPTMQLKDGPPINDDRGLEKEADSMGAKALNTTIQCYGPDEEEKLYHAFRQGSLQESLVQGKFDNAPARYPLAGNASGVIQLFDPYSWGAMGLYALGAYGAALAYHHLTNPGPAEKYNRKKHYGKTPTKQDRNYFGATPNDVVDHDPPLVVRYYEGESPTIAQMLLPWFYRPGYAQTQEERLTSGRDRSHMALQDAGDSNVQGGQMSKYSKDMARKLGL